MPGAFCFANKDGENNLHGCFSEFDSQKMYLCLSQLDTAASLSPGVHAFKFRP